MIRSTVPPRSEIRSDEVHGRRTRRTPQPDGHLETVQQDLDGHAGARWVDLGNQADERRADTVSEREEGKRLVAALLPILMLFTYIILPSEINCKFRHAGGEKRQILALDRHRFRSRSHGRLHGRVWQDRAGDCPWTIRPVAYRVQAQSDTPTFKGIVVPS